jgi:hypothetical protein
LKFLDGRRVRELRESLSTVTKWESL